jgi:hypothetical protein
VTDWLPLEVHGALKLQRLLVACRLQGVPDILVDDSIGIRNHSALKEVIEVALRLFYLDLAAHPVKSERHRRHWRSIDIQQRPLAIDSNCKFPALCRCECGVSSFADA